MATKEKRLHVKGLLENFEHRAHRGPPLAPAEIQNLRDFLHRHDFSPASDYFRRLDQLQQRMQSRPARHECAPCKRNYGGEAAGWFMQVQSIYDHVILSVCYDGEFRGREGRIKLSHRFNRRGRIEFVELKFLHSLQPCLNGALRKLLVLRPNPSLRPDWREAEAFVLPVLPQELVFLHSEIFHAPRHELLAWLVNIGHGLLKDVLECWGAHPLTGAAVHAREAAPVVAHSLDSRLSWSLEYLEGPLADAPVAGSHGTNGSTEFRAGPEPISVIASGSGGETAELPRRNGDQLPLEALRHDAVALPILQAAAGLQTAVEELGPKLVLVRYHAA